MAKLDSIFFEASLIQSFPSDLARAQFRQRWLGHYLDRHPSEAFMAFTGAGTLAGYLVGALNDPALDPYQQELGYFRNFAVHTSQFPAHLHVNVAAQHRSMGVGALLLDAFISHAKAHTAPGVHVVTGKGMRNVGFYERNGFLALAEASWNGRIVVMLGRTLR